MKTQRICRTSSAVAFLALLAATVATAAVAAPALPFASPGERPAGDEPQERRIPGQYIVVLEDSVERPGAVADAQAERHGGRLGFVYRDALNGYSARLSRDAVEALRANPRVKHVSPDYLGEVAAQAVPTGIKRTFASANTALDIDEADDLRVDVDVAVLDTGMDFEHPDLDVVARTDCAQDPTKFWEPEFSQPFKCIDEYPFSGYTNTFHGTHVAGTIGALDDGKGVVGVAPGARIWEVKVFDESGEGKLSEYIAGIDWVTNRSDSIEVANSSLQHLHNSSPPFSEAMANSVKAGVVHVVAAGNDNSTVNHIPANHPDAITVSALADFDGSAGSKSSTPPCDVSNWEHLGKEIDDTLANFSNFGSHVDVAAPGVCIYSTFPNPMGNYGYLSGTSMASPHVAGAAALLAARDNPQNQEDVEAIRNTLLAEGNQGWVDTSGDGVQEPLLDVGDEGQFTIIPTPPAATTKAVTTVGTSHVTLPATVNPNGFATTYQFEYGTTSSYGSKAPASPKSIDANLSPVSVGEAIGGLTPNTTYHFRIVATNAGGTAYGKDETFTTHPLPIAAYSFDEGTGTTLNDSAANHDGTIEGATWTTEGKYGSALDFDGTNDLVKVADANDLDLSGAFTLAAWVRPDNSFKWRSVLSKGTGLGTSSAAGYMLNARGGSEGPSGHVSNGSASKGVNGPTTLPTNAWSHLALTSDSAELRLYLDGQLVATAPAIATAATTASLEIGRLGGIFGTYFDGRIDELRIYAERLSQGQIEADRDQPVDPDPIAAYSFDEGTGTTLSDSAANHDGMIEGASWTTAGKYGSALDFDGANDLVKVPDANDLDLSGAFTLAAWVRPDNTFKWRSVLSKGTGLGTSSAAGYMLNARGGSEGPSGHVSNGSASKGVNGPTTLPTNAWSHLALTSDSAELRLYLDGELVATAPAIATAATTASLEIGRLGGIFGTYFDGRIDELRIYAERLSQGQIEADRDEPI